MTSSKPSRFGRQDVDIIERERVFDGYFKVDRYHLRHRLIQGGWSPILSREVFERGHAVGVLPYDPAQDKVVLIEQIRIGALAAGWGPWMVEIVAGIIDPGEALEDVAMRETQEECGAAVTDLIPVARYMPSPGAVSETVHVFCGRIESGTLPAIAGRPEEGEDIKVSAVPWTIAYERLTHGEFNNGLTIIALQWLALNRERLRTDWR
jgi:ADP-ribose pyrophosphatase